MKNEPMVKYDGRLVPQAGFRTFIYGANGETKLVNSWEEFQRHIETAIWFSDLKTAIQMMEKQKPKKKGD